MYLFYERTNDPYDPVFEKITTSNSNKSLICGKFLNLKLYLESSHSVLLCGMFEFLKITKNDEPFFGNAAPRASYLIWMACIYSFHVCGFDAIYLL